MWQYVVIIKKYDYLNANKCSCFKTVSWQWKLDFLRSQVIITSRRRREDVGLWRLVGRSPK